MIRMISNLAIPTLAITVALAGPAAAGEIRVSLIGKDDQAIQADIHKAAVKVCRDAYADDRTYEFYFLNDCVSEAEAGAMAQAKAYQQAVAAGAATSIAALSSSAPAPSR